VYNSPSGNAITIDSDYVVIDLNGYGILNTSHFGTYANGVYAWQRKNITIKNGSIYRFFAGIFLEDSYPFSVSTGHLVENVKLDNIRAYGILLHGSDMVIQNNIITSTGGHTISEESYGIALAGANNFVYNNTVTNTFMRSSAVLAVGIYPRYAHGCVVEFNRIINPAIGSGNSYCIRIKQCDNVIVSNNRMSTAIFGLGFDISTGKYRNNLAINCTTPYVGGSDMGNNN
jgi:hypothetical protein